MAAPVTQPVGGHLSVRRMLADVLLFLLATHLGGVLVPLAAAAFGVGMSLLGRRYGPLRAAAVVTLLNPSTWLGVLWSVQRSYYPEAPVGRLGSLGLLAGLFVTFLSAYLPTGIAWLPALLASPLWAAGWFYLPLTWAALSAPVVVLEPALRWIEGFSDAALRQRAAALLMRLAPLLPWLALSLAVAASVLLYRVFLRRVTQPAEPEPGTGDAHLQA